MEKSNDQNHLLSATPKTAVAFRGLSSEEQQGIEEVMLQRCGFSLEHRQLDFDTRDPMREKKLDAFARQIPVKSVFIGGPVGPGKTSYLAIMLRHLFREWATLDGHPAIDAAITFSLCVMFVTQEEFTTICLDQFRKSEDCKTSYTLQDLRKIPLLLFDDFGATGESSFKSEMMEALLDSRSANLLPLWITSNLSEADICNKNKFPDWQRLASRLFTRKWMAVVELPRSAKDRRKESPE